MVTDDRPAIKLLDFRSFHFIGLLGLFGAHPLPNSLTFKRVEDESQILPPPCLGDFIIPSPLTLNANYVYSH